MENIVESGQSFDIPVGFFPITVTTIPGSFEVIYPDSKWF
jgi:hypothetical protein